MDGNPAVRAAPHGRSFASRFASLWAHGKVHGTGSRFPSTGSAGFPSSTAFPLLEWLLVLLSFAIFATVRSHVPGVNEPHYLTKAKHFWDPAWCHRDAFLQSSNAHYVFYATVGVLTRFCSLEATAWIGRLVGWMLLSSGWTALAGRLLPFRWGAIWSAAVFLALAGLGNWSGEWVVGGIEAKVLSYGCGWWSLACALSGQPVRAAAWSGAAVSFHPVVGIWNTVAVAFALFIQDWRLWRLVRHWNWRELAGSAVAWSALAAPGLVPAVGMLRGADRNQSYQADYIQVFYRLAHHLDPWRFAASGYWGYAGLLALSAVLYLVMRQAHRIAGTHAAGPLRASDNTAGATAVHRNDTSRLMLERWDLVARYVVAAVIIALAGIAIRAIPDMASSLLDSNLVPGMRDRLIAWVKYKPHLAGWLKFYPFRLADVAVPWAAALLIVLALQSLVERFVARSTGSAVKSAWLLDLCGWLLCGVCFSLALMLPAIDRQASRLSPELFADWVDACHWIDRTTPPDALCYGANDGWALKWFAQRADYLSQKDCPQDAPGIIAWNERFKLISNWSNQHLPDGFSPSELRELRQLTGIDYLISRKFGPVLLEPVYQNRNYKVYQLPR